MKQIKDYETMITKKFSIDNNTYDVHVTLLGNEDGGEPEVCINVADKEDCFTIEVKAVKLGEVQAVLHNLNKIVDQSAMLMFGPPIPVAVSPINPHQGFGTVAMPSNHLGGSNIPNTMHVNQPTED